MNYIVDDIGEVVSLMRPFGTSTYRANVPYYMYGHREEIANLLRTKENDPVYKYQKYPLVVLRLDASENVHDGVIDYNLNLAIMDFTDKNYNAADRYTNVFKPVLYPLYQSFLKQLKDSGLFMFGSKLKEPKHTKVDRPFWGTPPSPPNEGNNKYIFSDPLDAIEIINLQLTQQIKPC